MIAFDVSLNGRRVCLAGIPGPCVMTSVLDWVERRPGDHPDAALPEKGLELHVGGLSSQSDEHVKWFQGSIPVGSEVAIRVVEVGAVDEPIERRASNRAGVLRCSFCNRAQSEVSRLIKGPHATICNQCVQVCIAELKA